MKNFVCKFFNLYTCLLVLLVSMPLLHAQVEVKVTDASCNGKKDGKIDVTVKGKNAPYGFKWNDGTTEDHLHDIASGTYSVAINDRNGCILEKTITVGVKEDKPQVKLTGGGDQSYCSETGTKEFDLRAIASRCGECVYKWSTGSSEESIKVSNDGDYKVTVSDTANCSKSDSTELKITDDCGDDEDEDVDIPAVNPKDPNDIIGPVGVGEQRWVSVKAIQPYTVRFENDPKFATAPAQKVVIRVPIDPHLNIYSFRLGKFGFGSFVFDVPENSTFYTGRLDVKDSLQVIVDVIAGVDVVKKEAFWILESKNPATGGAPAAHLGFLLVNDSITHKGEGFVNFSIVPDAAALTGDTVHAQASIVFDTEEALLTPAIFNTIDAFAPVSKHSRTDILLDSVYSYKVTAQDDYGFGGSGVKDYDLYLSNDDGNFALYASHIAIDSVLQVKGDPSKTYCAYSIARDQVGNEEVKSQPDACFSPKAKPFVRLKPAQGSRNVCQGSGYVVEWSSLGVDSVDIYLSDNNGSTFEPLALKVPAQPKAYYFPVNFEANAAKEYKIKIVDAAKDTLYDVTANSFRVIEHVPAKIYTTSGATICEGDSSVLNVLPIYASYKWSTGSTQSLITVQEGKLYTVSVLDANGCSSKDSVNMQVYRFPASLIAPAGPYKICQDKPLTLTAPALDAVYAWSTGDSLSQIVVRQAGKVALQILHSNGCEKKSDTITVTMITDEVECEALAVHDGQLVLGRSVQVAPNPVVDKALFQVLLPNSKWVNLKVFDAKGVEVADLFKGKVVGGQLVTIPFAPSPLLSNGLYVYKLIADDGDVEVGKLVINR